MASSSDDKGKRPREDDRQDPEWKKEQETGRPRPRNPAFEEPTKARRIFSHDMQGLICPYCITILYHNLLLFIDIFHI
jgi:hypothetical protein